MLLANARHLLKKRVPRRASDKLHLQGHLSAQRTHVRSQATRIITLVRKGTPRRHQGIPGFLPFSRRILKRLSRCLLVIASSIMTCRQQRSVLERQGVTQTPMQLGRFALQFRSIYITGSHRSMYPPCSLPHPVRPSQRLWLVTVL